MTHASAIGSVRRRIVAKARVDDGEAIVPAVRRSGWITGVTQLLVDPDDPSPEGICSRARRG